MTEQYKAVTEGEWKALATTEITHLTDEEKDYLPRAWDEWIARVRRDAAREAEARIKAVRELHSESQIIPGTQAFGCAECGSPNEIAPCATIRALDGDA